MNIHNSHLIIQVIFNLLLGVLHLVNGQHVACTPIYPQCICKTKQLSCSHIAQMKKNITDRIILYRGMNASAIRNDPSHASLSAGKYIGGIVRLVFHDAGDYQPTTFQNDGLRGDGCIDIHDPRNAGLSYTITILDELWIPYCNMISRADFWYLAAIAVIEASSPYIKNREYLAYDFYQTIPNYQCGISKHDHFIIPFRYGRIDRFPCTFPSNASRHPNAEGGSMEIKKYVSDKFGLDEKHSVALMGAHTFGYAQKWTSGYNSSWKDRPDLFTIEYFKLLSSSEYRRVEMHDPRSDSPLSQWNIQRTIGNRNKYSFMLNTDMAMLFNVSGTNTGNKTIHYNETCGPRFQFEENGVIRNHSYISCSSNNNTEYINLSNLSQWVFYFAEGNENSSDEPGASRWSTAFANALRIMGEVGYKNEDLICSYCPPESCIKWKCTTSMICTTGALDNLTESFMNYNHANDYKFSLYPNLQTCPCGNV